MSGFARRRGSNILRSCEHRAFGAPMNRNCTLWTLRVAWFESVFFASFLCRFGQRNDVLPRTVANSDKENIQLTQTAKVESSNPAMTPAPTPKPHQTQPRVRTKTLRLLRQQAAASEVQSGAQFLRASFDDPQSCR